MARGSADGLQHVMSGGRLGKYPEQPAAWRCRLSSMPDMPPNLMSNTAIELGPLAIGQEFLAEGLLPFGKASIHN